MSSMRGQRSLHVVEVLLDGLERQCAVLDDLRLVAGTLQELHRDLLVDDVCRGRHQLKSTSERRNDALSSARSTLNDRSPEP